MNKIFVSATALLSWSGERILRSWQGFYIVLKDGLHHYFVEDKNHYYRLVMTSQKDLSDGQV